MRRTPDFLKNYPDEALLDEVRRVAEVIGQPVLTRAGFTRESGISADALARRFGSWRKVLELAGLGHMLFGADEDARRTYLGWYTDEQMLDELRSAAELVGKPVLMERDFRCHSTISINAITQRFGSWQAALERAGIGHMYFYTAEGAAHLAHIKYTDDQMLEEVRRVAKLVGKPVLSTPDFTKRSNISLTTYKRFGNWRTVLELAGVGHMYFGPEAYSLVNTKHSDEDLLEAIRRVAEATDKPVLTAQDFARHSGISATTINLRLGGWRQALERLGLGHRFSRPVLGGHTAQEGYPDETILEEIRRVAALVGKPVMSRADFDRYAGVSSVSVVLRFGSWRTALERAGVGHLCRTTTLAGKTFHAGEPYTDEVLLEEVRRVAQVAGRPVLTQAEFAKHTSIDIGTLKRRFGSWRLALDRAGLGHMCSKRGSTCRSRRE